jgi:hypothetical protein
MKKIPMVARGPGQTKPATSSFSPVRGALLQRKCACGGTPGPTGECEPCRKKRASQTLQRAVDHPSSTKRYSSDVPPIVDEVLSSPGRPLDASTRAFMEPRFGHDFSGVRVHADARAAESAQAVNSIAYTVGRDVVFGSQQYSPSSPSGRRLLAHELTHTLQQSGAPGPVNNALRVGPVDDVYEKEAEAQATRIVDEGAVTRTAESTFSAPRLQRQPKPGEKAKTEKTSCMKQASKRVFSRGNDDPAECQYETARTTVKLLFDPCACSQAGITSIPLRLEYKALMGGKSYSDEDKKTPETQASTIAGRLNLEEGGGGAASGPMTHTVDTGKKSVPGDPGDTLAQSLDLQTGVSCTGGTASGSVSLGGGAGADRYTAEAINWSVTTLGTKVEKASLGIDETTPGGRVATKTIDVTGGKKKGYPKFPGKPRDKGCACHKVTGVQFGKDCKPTGGAGFGSGEE